ncbi:MAG: phosphate-starvation-inducible PsiE family protein [Acidobacteriota bacterium]
MPAELSRTRNFIARAFGAIEDLVYIGLGALLALSAVALLVAAAIRFGNSVFSGEFSGQVIPLLDRILLILLIVELLYTVQVSFRQHAVAPEPFLLVGLIAAIRRVLILTAEFGYGAGQAPPAQLVPELAVLSALLVAIALSLFVLRRKDTTDKVSKP